MIWAAIRWVLLMFLIAPVMEAPLVAHLSDPIKPIKSWTGNASWYGPGFNGRKTANGEIYSTEALTAAHPNLPFGSLVRLVNPRNGKFVLVRINDRGPYVRRRIVDLSAAAGRTLNIHKDGLALVRVEVVEPDQ